MKIDIAIIIRDHFKTLCNSQSKKISIQDITIFFVFPVAIFIACYALKVTVQDEFYNVSITFFGIFIALLLNIQVAVFGIFLRKWDLPQDSKSKLIVEEKLEQRKKLLGEINSNVSYLILVSCIALFASLVAYAENCCGNTFPAISSLIYSHFFATLLMVVKRVYVVFQKEYE